MISLDTIYTKIVRKDFDFVKKIQKEKKDKNEEKI